MKHKGFTLIELLVVVAIIAILATTILASLGQARAKARLARAQSEISSMRAAAELTTDSSGGYPSTLFIDDDSGMANLVEDVESSFSGKTRKSPDPVPSTGTGSWGFSLEYADGKWFCADSSGYAGEASGHVGIGALGADPNLCSQL